MTNDLSVAEFREMWGRMNQAQRERVERKALLEGMGLWAVLNEWPSLRLPENEGEA